MPSRHYCPFRNLTLHKYEIVKSEFCELFQDQGRFNIYIIMAISGYWLVVFWLLLQTTLISSSLILQEISELYVYAFPLGAKRPYQFGVIDHIPLPHLSATRILTLIETLSFAFLTYPLSILGTMKFQTKVWGSTWPVGLCDYIIYSTYRRSSRSLPGLL